MTDSESPGVPAGPGATLALEREARGFGQQEICDQLNFSSQVLSQLETDDYQALPPAAFVRGYLRSYARFLEVDPEPLVERFNQLTATQAESQVSAPVVPREARSSDPIMRVASVAVAVVLLLALIYWWLGNNSGGSVVDQLPAVEEQPEEEVGTDESEGDFPPDSELFVDSVQSAQTPSELGVVGNTADAEERDGRTEELLVSPAVESASLADEVADSESETILAVESPAESELIESPIVIPGPEPLAEESLVEAAADTSQAEEAQEVGSGVLLLQAQEESWVSVIDADQERLMYGMLTSGTPRKLEGVAPFEIILGVGDGITISYNGESVDFSSYVRRSRTARFMLSADGITSRLP